MRGDEASTTLSVDRQRRHEVVVVDRASDLVEHDWSRCVDSEDLFASVPWAASVERTFGVDRRYLLSSRPTAAEHAAATAYLAPPTAYPFYHAGRTLLSRLDSVRPGLGDELGLAAELSSHATSLVGPYGPGQSLDSSRGTSAIDALLDEVEALAPVWQTPVTGLLYSASTSGDLMAALRGRRWVQASTGAVCRFSVPAGGWEEYVDRFGGDTRRQILTERRQFLKNGLSIEPGDPGRCLPEVARLQADLEERHGHAGMGVEHQLRALEAIFEAFPERARIRLVRKEQSTVGFVLEYVWGRQIFVKGTGYDYERLGRRDFAYFNALFYSLMDPAAAEGRSQIHYGLGAYEAKVRRGCELQRLSSWFLLPERLRTRLEPHIDELATPEPL